MFLSIIIPIYNVEEYIRTCFESIYSQNIDKTSFEVIAVNDGTLDNSMKIVEEYKKKHSNILVINQLNEGVSSARNTGMSNATGKYVTFIDPDDYLSNDSLAVLCKKLVDVNYDIIVMNSIRKSKEVYDWRCFFSENDVVDGISAYLKGYTRGSACGVAYRKKFLIENAISFPLGVRNGEDTIFFANCQLYANRMSFLDLPFYNVFIRPNSASTYIDKSSIAKYENTAKAVRDLMNNYNLNIFQLSLLSNVLYTTISNCVFNSFFVKEVSLNFLIKEMHIQEFCSIIFNYTKGFSHSKKIGVIAMKISFSLYYFIMKIKYRKVIKFV